MNRISAIIPAALLVLSLAACGTTNTNKPAETSAEAQTTVEEAQTTVEEAAVAATTETAETAAAEAGTAAETGKTTYTNQDYVLSVPDEYKDLVTVKVPEADENGILFEVYENASVEAAKKQGEADEGAGWLFSIGTENEQNIREQLCGDMSGRYIFAKTEGGTYFVKHHPTDVRIVREQYDNVEEDMKQWTELNEWGEKALDTFINENEGLIPEKHSNTELDIYLARIAYHNDVNYRIASLEAGVMEPADTDPMPYVSRLMNGVTYEVADGVEAPDGEYVVLQIPDDGVRYDFFLAESGHNLVREVREIDGESYETLYRAVFTDDTATATEIMNEWYHNLVENGRVVND